jgi:Xaa-Pro dipeptidase
MDDSELLKELDSRKQKMASRLSNFKMMLIAQPENIFWLTNYQTAGHALTLLVIKENNYIMITRALEEFNIIYRTNITQYYCYPDNLFTDIDIISFIIDKIMQLLPRSVDDKIGVEFNSIPYNFAKQIESLLMMRNYQDISGEVSDLQCVKSPFVLDLIKKSSDITSTTIQRMIQEVKPGVTEDVIAAIGYYTMMKTGGEYPSYPIFVTTRADLAHTANEHRLIKPGSIVFLEAGGCYNRSHSAMMRTVYLLKKEETEAPYFIKEAEKLIVSAIIGAKQMMCDGERACDIDKPIRKMLSLNSFDGQQRARLAYPLGNGSFYPDWGDEGGFSIAPGETRRLKTGMVFHLIPWFIIPGIGGIGLSDTVVVGPNGATSVFDCPPPLCITIVH